MELNELLPGMREVIAPTDSRLRPDQMAMENGDLVRPCGGGGGGGVCVEIQGR